MVSYRTKYYKVNVQLLLTSPSTSWNSNLLVVHILLRKTFVMARICKWKDLLSLFLRKQRKIVGKVERKKIIHSKLHFVFYITFSWAVHYTRNNFIRSEPILYHCFLCTYSIITINPLVALKAFTIILLTAFCTRLNVRYCLNWLNTTSLNLKIYQNKISWT